MRNPFGSTIWRNQAFVRVWTAATISIFGSLVTRIALPLVAILVLGSGAVEVVLPEPCRPTIATTAGLPDRWNVRSPPDRSATSSSLTILTTC